MSKDNISFNDDRKLYKATKLLIQGKSFAVPASIKKPSCCDNCDELKIQLKY